MTLLSPSGFGSAGRRTTARLRSAVAGRGPADGPAVLVPPARRAALVDWAVYRNGARLPAFASYAEAAQAVRDDGGFVWIGLHGPSASELDAVAEEFGLHPLAVEDAVQAHQRPKLERYDDMLFAALKTVRYVEHDELTSTSEVVDTGEVMVFVGRDYVITVRHGEHGGLGGLRRRLEAQPELLARGPSSVLHAVADNIVDSYLAVADAMQADIDEIEASVFSRERTRDVERIYQLKRELIQLKRAVTPLEVPLRTLAERHLRLVDSEVREYFRDVDDHLTRVREQVGGFDELLNSILQASLAQITVAESEDMRRISAWVAILAVPTMIAGLYGMNFAYVPELQWHYGYPMVLVLIVVICSLMHRGFRRNGWL